MQFPVLHQESYNVHNTKHLHTTPNPAFYTDVKKFLSQPWVELSGQFDLQCNSLSFLLLLSTKGPIYSTENNRTWLKHVWISHSAYVRQVLFFNKIAEKAASLYMCLFSWCYIQGVLLESSRRGGDSLLFKSLISVWLFIISQPDSCMTPYSISEIQ